jgi:hypothetical protein
VSVGGHIVRDILGWMEPRPSFLSGRESLFPWIEVQCWWEILSLVIAKKVNMPQLISSGCSLWKYYNFEVLKIDMRLIMK